MKQAKRQIGPQAIALGPTGILVSTQTEARIERPHARPGALSRAAAAEREPFLRALTEKLAQAR